MNFIRTIRSSTTGFISYLLFFSVIASGFSIALFTSSAHALSAGTTQFSTNLFVEIAKRENPAVVNVSTRSKTPEEPAHFRQPAPSPSPSPDSKDPFKNFYDRFFGERQQAPRPKSGMGSGFIIDASGHILTNYHVVEGAEEITVLLEDGKEYTAELIGSDSKTDIALIKIKNENESETFPFLKMGDSENLEVGEWVVAIGNPFGLSHTVTVGVVSALGRSIGAGPYDEFIQTDASINPGNSGGPLININGDVIGINTAIISGNTGGNVGIGFAIPINIAKGILADLKEKGTVTRGWLGVMIQKITPELATSFGLSSNEGALVGDVIPGGPADKAGIKRGDVIVKFDGKDIKDMEMLPKVVASISPGSDVNVVVIRNGIEKLLSVKIEVLKDASQTVVAAAVDPLGLKMQDITPQIAQSLQLESTDGVLVSDVTPGEPGAEAGLRRGDVVTEMNRAPIMNMDDYNRLKKGLQSGKSALFLVRRGGNTIYIAVKID
ncbi:MAG: serine protease Do [Nitrospinae bacterium CG11_big_fil_rev_8_21_14_0_20_45_15]|nr:MAG: serine protease Do [Nitrospinae bacterium CG11_big_fil_rev_8_21_14_0_20_45_15]